MELEEDVGKLRRKLEAECPPVDFEKAQRLLEEGITQVKEERKTLLAQKRSLSKKRKAPEQDQPAPKKPKQSAAPPPPWGCGPPQYQRPTRGRGRGRGRGSWH